MENTENVTLAYLDGHKIVGACGIMLSVLGDLPPTMRDVLRPIVDFLQDSEIDQDRVGETIQVEFNQQQMIATLNALALLSALLGDAAQEIEGCPFTEDDINQLGESLNEVLTRMVGVEA